MPYAEREFLCAGCGALIVRRASARSRPRCAPCAIQYSADCMVEIHSRNGDAYERWLLASIAAYARMLEEYRQRQGYEDPVTGMRRG